MKSKMKLHASLKVWVVIYPSITLLYYLLGERLSALPLYQRTFIITISLVPWMIFVGLPIVDSVIKKTMSQNKVSKQSNPGL